LGKHGARATSASIRPGQQSHAGRDLKTEKWSTWQGLEWQPAAADAKSAAISTIA
jgi:hypothetical protein